MEVAGVVLGAVPIIMIALDGYERTRSVIKDTQNWLETIEEIQDIVFIQIQGLRNTLHSLGIEWAYQSSIPIAAIEIALKIHRPLQWNRFLSIIRRMDRMLHEIAKDLCPDISGPVYSLTLKYIQPNCTDLESSRVQWEWNKVRRSFRRGRREEIDAKLTKWNDALRSCGFEHPEIPTDQGKRRVDELCTHFNDKDVMVVRQNAVSLHKAINAGWGCSCVEPHSSNILLNWHGQEKPKSTSFLLELPSSVKPCSQHKSMETEWRLATIRVRETLPSTVSDKSLPLVPVEQEASVAVNSTRRKTRFSALKSITSQVKPTGLPSLPMAPPVQPVLSMTPACSKRSQTNSSSASITPEQPSIASPYTISPLKLCMLAQTGHSSQPLRDIIPIPDSEPSMEVHLVTYESQQNKISKNLEKSVPLQTLLSGTMKRRIQSRFKLTRKERFGIAAALVWGTMHLCDSEWLNDAISEKSIGVTFGDDDDRSSSLRTFGHPYLNISFPNSRIEHEPSVQVGRQSAQQYQKDEFISQQIQNKTLYTLAIRLMEVGLEKDFDKLRQEYEEDFPPEPSGTPISDLEIAQYHIDSLSYDGGINYRNAVESCLKFLFPGPSEKCFHYVPFRKAFFNAVVAPVQNVYDAIDEYQYQAV